MSSRLTWGIVIGLVLGKLVGISLGTALAVRLRVGTLPPGLPVNQVLGGAALSGIGFTISLFIVDLALDDPALQDEARVGVLAASVLAALLGWSVFRVAAALGREPSGPPMRLSRPVDPERDHVRGPVGRPADAGRVRRLRVPVLQPCDGVDPGRPGALRRPAAVRVPAPAARGRAPARRPGRGGE